MTCRWHVGLSEREWREAGSERVLMSALLDSYGLCVLESAYRCRGHMPGTYGSAGRLRLTVVGEQPQRLLGMLVRATLHSPYGCVP
jgi:hypothetical protein